MTDNAQRLAEREENGHKREFVGAGAALTLNEAKAILRVYRHWPACERSLPMGGGEFAAWTNLVSAARSRICVCGHPLGPHEVDCPAETYGR